jgi:hypothetical protein
MCVLSREAGLLPPFALAFVQAYWAARAASVGSGANLSFFLTLSTCKTK